MNKEQFNSELIAVVFGGGASMEGFIHSVGKKIDQIHRSRLRVLLCLEKIR